MLRFFNIVIQIQIIMYDKFVVFYNSYLKSYINDEF